MTFGDIFSEIFLDFSLIICMIAISKTCLKSLQNKNIWILTEEKLCGNYADDNTLSYSGYESDKIIYINSKQLLLLKTHNLKIFLLI